MNGKRFYVDLMQDRSEVTGSFNLAIVKIDDRTIKFAVDCGLYQEKGYEEQNLKFPVKPEELDFMILTHNHVDHTGRFPYLVKDGFYRKIYTSEITKRILGRALYDNARVLRDTSKRKNILQLYDDSDVAKTIELVEGCEYNKPIQVADNVRVTLAPNGHLIGAASVLVQIHNPGSHKDINIFFTGDYSGRNIFFRVPHLRKWITELPLTIVAESTYAYMNSDQIKEIFQRNIAKALKKRKTIVVPVFSLGRAQEILYFVKNMQSKNPELFENVPLYYDGKLSFYYTDQYQKLQEEGLLHFYKDKKEFLPENIQLVDNRILRKEIIGQQDTCKIIITTSGMGSYGPAQVYIPAFISNPNALIHFTGYCAEGTRGYELKMAEKESIIEFAGVKAIKKADVEFTNEFSAHAKADEMIKFLKRFQNPLFVMVNHGEDKSKEMLADRVLKEIPVNNVGILGREYFYRIDPDGFVKSLATKFL